MKKRIYLLLRTEILLDKKTSGAEKSKRKSARTKGRRREAALRHATPAAQENAAPSLTHRQTHPYHPSPRLHTNSHPITPPPNLHHNVNHHQNPLPHPLPKNPYIHPRPFTRITPSMARLYQRSRRPTRRTAYGKFDVAPHVSESSSAF